jgi:hypothetical protein
MASTVTTAYDGAITRVGSSRVRQSTTARATPTGTRYSSGMSAHSQPTRAPTRPATTAEARAHFQPSPRRAAIEA